MQIGRRIFWDKLTGDIILDIGEKSGAVTQTTVEYDITAYKVLKERNRETFDVIELEYGAYAQDFAEGRLIGVDLTTKAPIFEYPNPENPSEPIIPPTPLSEQVKGLEVELTQTKEQLKTTDTSLMEFMDYYFTNGGM